MDTSTNDPKVTRKAEPESEVKDSSVTETKSPKEESTSANKTPLDTEPLKLQIKKFSSRSSDFKAAIAKGASGCKLCSFMATEKDLADHTAFLTVLLYLRLFHADPERFDGGHES